MNPPSFDDSAEHREGTSLSTVAWGLKRFWWVVLLGAVLGTATVPLYLYQQPQRYDATALVVAAELSASITVLPRYGTAVFDNGEVAREVAGRFGAGGDLEDVVPKKVSMVAAQDSIVMEVTGHADNRDDAVGIADLAAETFVGELNSAGAGVGVFLVQSRAAEPVEVAEPFKAAPYSLVVGAIGGLILGLGIVLLLLVLRRPLVAGSRGVGGLPVVGTMMLSRQAVKHSDGAFRLEGATSVARNILSRSPGSVCILGTKRQDVNAQIVARSIRDAFSRARRGELLRRTDGDAPPSLPVMQVDSPDDPQLLELAASALVVVVVQEGTKLSSLRRVADPFDAGQAVVVVVRRTFRNGLDQDVADMPPPAAQSSFPAGRYRSPGNGVSHARPGK